MKDKSDYLSFIKLKNHISYLLNYPSPLQIKIHNSLFAPHYRSSKLQSAGKQLLLRHGISSKPLSFSLCLCKIFILKILSYVLTNRNSMALAKYEELWNGWNFDLLFCRNGSVATWAYSHKSKNWVSKKFLFCYCLLDYQLIWSLNNDIHVNGCFNLRCLISFQIRLEHWSWVFIFWANKLSDINVWTCYWVFINYWKHGTCSWENWW